MQPREADASIDLCQMRDLISTIPPQDHPSEAMHILVPQSPPAPEDRVLSSQKFHTAQVQPPSTTRTSKSSHDHTGDLHLNYSLTLSQIDLGQTQVDSSSVVRCMDGVRKESQSKPQSRPPSRHAPGGALEPIYVPSSGNVPENAPELEALEMELEETQVVDEPGYGDDECEFMPSPTAPDIYHNPLANIFESARKNALGLSQLFNAPSSPVGETRLLDSQPLPTPNAVGIMAKSMLKKDLLEQKRAVQDNDGEPEDRDTEDDESEEEKYDSSQPSANANHNPLSSSTGFIEKKSGLDRSMLKEPSRWDDRSSSPGRKAPARRGIAGTPDLRGLIKDSSQFETPTKKPTDITDSPARPHSSPPSSPPVGQPLQVVTNGDDLLFSESQRRKRKVAAKMKKGEMQVRNFIKAASISVTASEPVRPLRKKPSLGLEKKSKETGAKRAVIGMVDGDETTDDTGSESQSQPIQPQRKGIRGKGKASALPTTQVPATPPTKQRPNAPQKPQRSPRVSQVTANHAPTIQVAASSPFPKPQSPPLDLKAWDHLHAPPKLPTRTRPPRRRSQPPPRHTNSVPADSGPLQLERTGTSTNPTSLTQMVPFNVPASPTAPDRAEEAASLPCGFVRESSRLTSLPSSSQAPVTASSGSERQATVPPLRHLDSVVNKRSRGDFQDRPTSQLKSFAALENSQPPLSSQEDPDDVDMLDIVEGVGAGKQPGLTMPAPSPPVDKGHARKQRKTAMDTRVAVIPLEEELVPETPTRPSVPPSHPPPSTTPTTGTKRKGKVSMNETTAYKVAKTTAQKRRTSARFDARGGAVLVPAVTATPPSPPPGDPITFPQRVFAFFKDQNLMYHPATMLPNDPRGAKVRVVFDDGSLSDLERHCVRSLDLRIGDVVRVDMPGMKKTPWVVRRFPEKETIKDNEKPLTDIRGNKTVIVAPKNSKNPSSVNDEVSVQITVLYLTKSLWTQFATRDMSSAIIFPTNTASLVRSTTGPSSSCFNNTAGNNAAVGISLNSLHAPITAKNPPVSLRMCGISITTSVPDNNGPSNPATAPHNLFAGMTFVLTFSDDNELGRYKIGGKILKHGGKLLGAGRGFEEFFFDFDPPSNNPESRIELQLKPEYRDLGFTCVIADGHNRRAKYFQALAFGLPCIAPRWIEDCIIQGTVISWEHYLLAAGNSDYLDGAVRSRSIPVTDPHTTKFLDTLSSPSVFSGWNVLFLTKGQDESKIKTFTFLFLAGGATQVMLVKTLEAADHQLNMHPERWDVLFIHSSQLREAGDRRLGVPTLEGEDMIQSLILGKTAR